MSFGSRLGEERKRLGFKQAEFAALAGTDVPKQSLYENDRRQLRARYLARLATVGVDLLYVVTGRRSEGALLGDDAAAFIAAYLSLPEEVREAVQRFAGDLTRYVDQAPRSGAESER